MQLIPPANSIDLSASSEFGPILFIFYLILIDNVSLTFFAPTYQISSFSQLPSLFIRS